MYDNSVSLSTKNSYPTKLILPPAHRPHWVASKYSPSPLLYLSWGSRTYGKEPIPATQHEGWSYTLILSGKPTLQIDSRLKTLNPGDIVIIPPETPFGWANCSLKAISKHLTWIWKEAPPFALEPHQTVPFYHSQISLSDIPEFESLHHIIRNEVARPDTNTTSILLAYKQIIDAKIDRLLHTSVTVASTDLRFELAVQWMHQHKTLPNPISTLIDYLQISSATLNRLFQNKSKQTPHRFFQMIKCEAARKILLSEEVSIKEVSYRMGYRHPNDFTRSFTSFYGRSPSTLRKQKMTQK